jgi:hypothetical protein
MSIANLEFTSWKPSVRSSNGSVVDRSHRSISIRRLDGPSFVSFSMIVNWKLFGRTTSVSEGKLMRHDYHDKNFDFELRTRELRQVSAGRRRLVRRLVNLILFVSRSWRDLEIQGQSQASPTVMFLRVWAPAKQKTGQ